jgi:predicted DNA-binding ribbon-helix-helix protein
MEKSAIIKHSIVVRGRKTSISLENAFWRGLKEIATRRNSTLSELVTGIGTQREEGNLSSAIRLFVLDHFRAQAVCKDAPTVSRPIGDPAGDPSARAG